MEQRINDADRPARPILALAAAVYAGAWIGAEGPLDLKAWRIVLALLLCLWIASLVLRSGRRGVWIAILCVASAVGGLRARSTRSDGPDPRIPFGASSGASVDAALDAHAEHDALVGPWDPFPRVAGGGPRGRIGSSRATFEIEDGWIAPGELVAVRPAREPRRLPRGPELGSRAERGARGPIDLRPDEIVRLAPATMTPLSWIEARVTGLRNRLVARTTSIRDPLTRPLVQALVLGDTSALPLEVPDLFVRTGTFHVLAVSGMQVVLVLAFLVLPIARALARVVRACSRGRVRATAEWMAVPLVALFVPIAGSAPPVVRSAIGCALAGVAPRSRAGKPVEIRCPAGARMLRLPQRADALSLWALALLVECVVHPDAPTSLSVQLSYAATLGLIVGTGPLLGRMRGLAGREGWIARVGPTGRARSPWIRIPLDRTIDVFVCALAASVAAVIATLPFTWTRLGEWSPAGIVATPALLPSMTALLVLGWLRVLVPPLAPDVLLDPCAHAMTASMRFFDAWPGTPTPLAPRPLALIVVAATLTFIASRPGTRAFVARCAALAWAALLVPWTLAPDRLEITALDVGAGTAIVLRAPLLGTWIFDAGSRDRPDVAREALGPYLRRLDAGPISIALSHTDLDHHSALPWVIERYPPQVWAGALPAHIAERLPHTTRVVDVGPGRMQLQSIANGGLWLERGLDVAGNEGSRFVRVRFRNDEVVLAGDAEGLGLAAWLRLAPTSVPLQLLTWPHHGSDSGQIESLVRATQPRVVWISAGAEPPVGRELARRGIPWRWTARDGPLQISIPLSADAAGSGTIPAQSSGPP